MKRHFFALGFIAATILGLASLAPATARAECNLPGGTCEILNVQDHGPSSLRSFVKAACDNPGDDELTFRVTQGGIIRLETPIKIPETCQGKVSLKGPTQVKIVFDGTRLTSGQCSLLIEGQGHAVRNLHFAGAVNGGRGICLRGAEDAVIENNSLGTVDGVNLPGNEIGILLVLQSQKNRIEGNLIRKNTRVGVLVNDGSSDNEVLRNTITENGTNPGSNPAPTSVRSALDFSGLLGGLKDILPIGGATAGVAKGGGISVVSNVNGESVRNLLQENKIFKNVGLGIDLGDDGVTTGQDPAATGPNHLMPIPKLRAIPVTQGNSRSWLIAVKGEPDAKVQIFRVDPTETDDSFGHGEGLEFIFQSTIRPDGTVLLDLSDPVALGRLREGDRISALQTLPEHGTSEFSGNVRLIDRVDCIDFAFDRDCDEIPDDEDNCPDVFNPDQADSNGFQDGDGIGDACEEQATPNPTPDVTPTPDPTPDATPTPDPTPDATPTPDPTPDPVCGNNVLEAGEQCDDGNILAGDGCSATCQLENLALCGNGTVNPGEECDDGNKINGDGCNDTCQNEAGATPTPTPGPVDCPPTSLIATAVSSAQIDLSWVDNCPNEMGYKIERGDPGLACDEAGVDATFDEVGTVGVNVTTYQDLGAPTPPLGSNTVYCYRVRAFFGGFQFSEYSNKDDARTFPAPADVPTSPDHLTATAISSTQVAVNWIDNAVNETAYELWRSVNDCSSFALVKGDLPADTTNFIDTGLTPSTLYCYKVRAKNSVGASNFSNTDDATTFPEPKGVPNPATQLRAIAVSSSQVDVTWLDNAIDEEGYKLERSEHPTCELGLGFIEIPASLGPNTTSFNDTGLNPNTRYCYRVRPFNSQGNGAYSNIDAARTLGLPAQPPTGTLNLVADGVTSSRIDIEFVDLSDNETGFVLERANGACSQNNNFAPIANLPASPGVSGAVQHSDLGLPASTFFCYRVKAVNAAGDSPYSNRDDAQTLAVPTTPPQSPIDLRADATGPHQVTVKWTDNSSNEDHFVVQRADGTCSATSAFSDLATVPAALGTGLTVTFIDNSVDDGTTYCYRVLAVNVVGDSQPSNADDATTPRDPICAAGDSDTDSICDDTLNGNPDPDSGEGPGGTDTDGDGTPDAGDEDSDGDSVSDEDEAGDSDPNTPPQDTDGDGTPDFRDDDSDNDGVDDENEAGDDDPSTPPVDTDDDGTPDFQDTDSDGDGVPDGANGTPLDNCRVVANPDQKDQDQDGLGDACDSSPGSGGNPQDDRDGDGIPDSRDNCPTVANPDQADADKDGIGDICDPTPGAGFFPMLQGSGCSLSPALSAQANGANALVFMMLAGLMVLRRRMK